MRGSGDRTVTDREAADEVPVRGRACGRYLLLDVLGGGGNGVVYRAYDPELDRQLAIKLVRATPTAGDARRVYREAKAIARLSHRNVLAVYYVGDHDGHVFIAMELASGTLREWLAREQPGERAILDCFVQAARGLLAAHDVGLVHRDLKPANVLLAADDTPKVADFGLARGYAGTGTAGSGEASPGALRASLDAGDSPEHTLTATGLVLGTPAYMAPEQLAGGRVDHRADQYSSCVALHEALTGLGRSRSPASRPFHPRSWSPGCARACGGDSRPTQPTASPRCPSSSTSWHRCDVPPGVSASPPQRGWPRLRLRHS